MANACEVAAKFGNLECLRFAHEHGCPLTYEVIVNATEGNYLECLRYAVEHGCSMERESEKEKGSNSLEHATFPTGDKILPESYYHSIGKETRKLVPLHDIRTFPSNKTNSKEEIIKKYAFIPKEDVIKPDVNRKLLKFDEEEFENVMKKSGEIKSDNIVEKEGFVFSMNPKELMTLHQDEEFYDVSGKSREIKNEPMPFEKDDIYEKL